MGGHGPSTRQLEPEALEEGTRLVDDVAPMPTRPSAPVAVGGTLAAGAAGGAALDRLCPKCGAFGRGWVCAADGVPTVDMAALAQTLPSFVAGDVIGDKYRVVGPLGRGAFGAVYRCAHVATHQQLAVKVLALPPEDVSPSHVRRFFQEAEITASLVHANTVRVFDFGQTTQGPLFLAMEFVAGELLASTLQRYFQRGSVMPAAEATWIGIEMLRSLHEAHRKGLVHRDIKPANVMVVTGQGEESGLKVLDFGIARVAGSSLTQEGTALGTPTYMSPEQSVGAAVDGRSDLYAVATLLYLAVAGRPPFQDSNPLMVLDQHRRATPPDVRSVAPQPVPDAFADVIMRGLAKRPEERFDDAAAMRSALEGAAGGAWAHTPFALPVDHGAATMAAPVLLTGQQAGQADVSPTRRGVVGLAVAVALVVAALAALGWWATAGERDVAAGKAKSVAPADGAGDRAPVAERDGREGSGSPARAAPKSAPALIEQSAPTSAAAKPRAPVVANTVQGSRAEAADGAGKAASETGSTVAVPPVAAAAAAAEGAARAKAAPRKVAPAGPKAPAATGRVRPEVEL